MKKQSQKIQNYDSDLTTDYIFGFDKSTLIWIIFSISMYVLGLIVGSYLIFTYFSTSDFWDGSEKAITENEKQIQKTAQIIKAIQECAIPSPDQRCILLYSTPDIEAKCNQLEELKDQCLYNFATINQRPDTCDTITDTTLKNKCQEEIQMFFISDE